MSGKQQMDDAAIDVALSSKSQALIPMTGGAMLSNNLIGAMNNGQGYFYSTLKATNHKERLRNARFLASSSNDIDEIIAPKTFAVKDFVISKAMWTDEKGETIVTPKLILINPQEKAIVIMANIWVRQFVQAISELGLPPWDEPIKVSASQEKGNGPNKYYTLVFP